MIMSEKIALVTGGTSGIGKEIVKQLLLSGCFVFVKYGHNDKQMLDGFIEDLNMNDFRKVIDVNLIGKVICTKYAIPLLSKADNASIVNIASRLGARPCEEASAYCAAEAGIINFTMASALELSKYNIRVNAVSPGLTNTPLAMAGWTKEEIEYQKENNPLRRIGETIDIANAVLYLLSEKASYVNGENINVNGGTLLK